MENLAEVFPIPIAGFNLESINSSNIDSIKTYISSLESQEQGSNGSLSHNQQVLNEPIFEPIKEEIYKHLKKYIDYCDHAVEDVKIVSSWSNIVNENEHIHIHYHENSYISGVIHLTEGSNLVIRKPIIKRFYQIDTEYRDVSKTEFLIPAATAQLVLFPSMLPHYVQDNNSKDTRLSIAFNTWPLKYGSPAAWVDLTQT